MRDLWRNPRRTLAAMVGTTLGVGLFCAVLFFVDASGATMTARAIAPLTLDLQSVLESPLGRRIRFDEHVSGPSPLRAGQATTFTLTVTNTTTDAVHEIVVHDEPPPPLSYVHDSTTLNGVPLPDDAGQSPLDHGLARTGLNVGTLGPGEQVTLTYAARANLSVSDVRDLGVRGTVSSREDVVPAPANAEDPVTVDELRTAIAGITGVAAADAMSFVDLPPGSVEGEGSLLRGPVRIFAFDRAYQQRHPSIRVIRGSFEPGAAIASAEASRALALDPGASITLRLPGATALRVRVSGVADLAQALPLFSSRKASKLDDFLYVPFAVIVAPATFRDTVVPAFRAASAQQGTIVKNLPVSEVDVVVDRSLLRAAPADAAAQTRAIARAVAGIAPGQHHEIDNISNALEVATDDAVTARRMFVFLGLPGMLLGVFLTVFGAGIHAQAHRREQATLRLRGASSAYLLRLTALKALSVAGAGSALGACVGLLCVMVIIGGDELSGAAVADLVTSAVVGVGAGIVVTTLTLLRSLRRSMQRGVSEERRELASESTPLWHRWHLDLALLCVATLAVVVQLGDRGPPSASVSEGQSATLPTRLLVAPLAIWMGGALISVRAHQAVIQTVTRARNSPALRVDSARFGPLVRGVLVRSLGRRRWSLATGTVCVALIVAFAANVAGFARTYERARAADSRFVVGSDLRITPGADSARPLPSGYAASLMVAGVSAVSPVVSEPENSVLIGPYDQDRTDLAAIDPASFTLVADGSDSPILDAANAAGVAALGADRGGLLVRSSLADDLSIETGDRVQVLLARGTPQQTLRRFRVVGLFETFPGFPRGIDLVGDISAYESATRLTRTDFFLARASDSTRTGLARAVGALRSGPGRHDPLRIATTASTLDRDRSSLTAVNVRGLVDLDTVAAMAMGSASMAIVVFGVQLQRRKEYLTLGAHGVSSGRILVLVLGEALVVALSGLGIGLMVGTGMARVFVRVLRPLFILDPPGGAATGRLVQVGAVLLASTLAWALSAMVALHRLRPTAILREP